MINGIINPGSEKKNLKDIIDKYYDLKDNLNQFKEYFNKLFIQSKVDKSLLYYEKEGCKFKNEFIGKKRILDSESESNEEEEEILNKDGSNSSFDGKIKIKTTKIYLTKPGFNK
jgi:hypothetical protein